MATKPRALIVGAGIAGLAAAWWLDKAGWTSVIIERHESIRDGGYVMVLSGPSCETINQMDLKDSLKEVSYTFNENVISDGAGHEILRIQYKDIHGGSNTFATCRDDLARILFKALPESAVVRFSETLQNVSDHDNKIQATLGNGETIEADLLIGADGLRSSVRDRFWNGEDCLEHLGYTYAVYDIDDKKKLRSDCVSFNRPGHMDVLYQLRNNRQAALHIWRDDAVQLHDRASRMQAVRDAIAEGGVKLINDAVDSAEQAGCTPVIDGLIMVNLPKWSKGRVLLLGDAAHCLTLMSGQGAGMALASAEVLGKELMATKDVSEALANHEKKIRPVVKRLQDRSRSLAAMFIPRGWFRYYLRNLFLKFMPYSWIISWFMNSAKAELELTKS
ncbi:2-polyprenyl-6-methoxyphenol hydroxylase [Niveomyces insectorum RCEF 264]|uniref:2-polyprenyl-6-methoxyphenol hydroxylase n=1 Tax=Niveomyces insectorum RCEF 264 TaxID=1081102 RepID=A0A167P3N2_9HYPO|nr:2-polyprenyl-6-methoxyphenol hydroxylase [Niveomyces insectorum RCEF 264]